MQRHSFTLWCELEFGKAVWSQKSLYLLWWQLFLASVAQGGVVHFWRAVHRHTLEIGHPVLTFLHEKDILKAEGGQGSESKIVLQILCVQGLRQKVKESCSTAVPFKEVAFQQQFCSPFCTVGVLHIWLKNESSVWNRMLWVYTFLLLPLPAFLELCILENPVCEKSDWIKDISCLYFLCPAFYKFKSLPLH